METLSRVAQRGDVVCSGGLRLEVERVSGRRVETVIAGPEDAATTTGAAGQPGEEPPLLDEEDVP